MCAEDDAVVIEVEDSRVGMEEATRQRLFEPFFATKDADRGTGLGLSIIYAIVRNHDGAITVESDQGIGTMFRVRLPVVDESYPLTSVSDSITCSLSQSFSPFLLLLYSCFRCLDILVATTSFTIALVNCVNCMPSF